MSETQTETLRAAVDRLIPADEDPGGWAVGGGYFPHLLAREPQFLPAYRHGLDALEDEARASDDARPFVALTPDAQDALLARVEAGAVRTHWPLDPAAFFRLLVEQTTEAYYADPGNGGNRDGLGWAMIGYRVTA